MLVISCSFIKCLNREYGGIFIEVSVTHTITAEDSKPVIIIFLITALTIAYKVMMCMTDDDNSDI